MATTLNPYAAPFVPFSYRTVEDFSPEWWGLVKSSPWFRDFWLRERFDEENLDDKDFDDPEIFSIYESVFHPSDAREKCEKKKKSTVRMDLMPWGADKWLETRFRPSDVRRCSEKAHKLVSMRVSPRTIQQPR